MYHTREEVIERTIREYELLDKLLSNLTPQEWDQLLVRPENKDPWTVKDAVAHITHWKADIARSARGQRRPAEERGLNTSDGNHLVYLRWHNRSPHDVLAWHRQVQQDVLAALTAVPDEWFDRKDRRKDWPYDLVDHSAYHRVNDIGRALKKTTDRD